MNQSSREVGVVVSRRPINNPWVDHIWSPVMIMADAPEAAPWSKLPDDGSGATLYYAGPALIDLFSTDTASYRDNLIMDAPQIWVALRIQVAGEELELVKVTADPTEGEALFSAGSDVIGTVPMPPDIASWVAQFVDQFHVEQTFIKRKRDKSGGRRSALDDEGGAG